MGGGALRLSVFFPYQVLDLRQLRAVCTLAERLGYGRLWTGNSLAIDTKLALAAVSQRVQRLELGTAVSVMQFRHPLQAAIEARSLAAITGGRFALGLGVSERAVVEGLGLPWIQPLAYAREYLAVVRQALAEDGVVAHDGDVFRVHAELQPLACEPPPVLLGALAEPMARLAGEVADGALTWLAPPEYLERVTVPAVRAGAAAAGRPAPPVIALVPCVATASERLAHDVSRFAMGTHIGRPHYARMLRAAGLPVNGEVTRELMDAVVAWGSPDEVAERVARYRDAGADEVAVAAYLAGDEPARLFERTLEAVAAA